MDDKLVARVKEIASWKAKSDDPEFSVNDWAGGNIDDAYTMGVDDGEIWMARQLIEQYPSVFAS